MLAVMASKGEGGQEVDESVVKLKDRLLNRLGARWAGLTAFQHSPR